MYYSKWATKEEVLKSLSADVSGIPIVKEEGVEYCLDGIKNNLVIGCNGSGKTQAVILPLIKKAIDHNESFVVKDNNDILEIIKTDLEKNNYKSIVIKFSDINNSNCYNPLTIAYNLYKSNNDSAISLVEDIGYYLLSNKNETNSDPFWINSCIDYFTGLVIYAFDNYDNVTLSDIYSLSNDLTDEIAIDKFMEKIDKHSNVYMNLIGTLGAPKETRGSIISVFNQKIKAYVSRNNMLNLLSKNDIDFTNLNQKCAIFIVSDNEYTDNLTSLLISQINSYLSITNNKNIFHIIIPEFDELVPFKDCSRMLNDARKHYTSFTLVISSFTNLNNIYGIENANIIKACFEIIIYLLSKDMETLNEVSSLCGMKDKELHLISVDELKRLNKFEAVVLIVRLMPFKTILVPYYMY